MHRIRIEPDGIEIPAAPGATPVEAAEALGFYWPVGCNRNGECTNCAMEVIAGMGRLSPMGRFERQNLLRQRGVRALDDPRLRLGCQARVAGDIIVIKRGVQPPTEGQRVSCHTSSPNPALE